MKNFRGNKNNIIIGLCAVVILMGIGFAAFSQRLEIGDTTTTSSDWNVYIKSAVAEAPVGGATGSAQVVDRASAKLTANLTSPGDSVTYTITVANDGNIDAVLDVITLSASNTDSVIKYSYAGIEEDEELLAQTETSFTVTIEYDSTKTGTVTDAQKQNTLTLDLDYVQKGMETITPKLITIDMGGIDVPVITTGDGLYADTYESGRYVYKGADPANYLWLDINNDSLKTDNENYRIVAIEENNTIKVVAQNSIGNMPWDKGGNRYSTLETDYCNSSDGCKVWGSSTTMLDLNGNNVTVMPREAGNNATYKLPNTEASLNTYLNTTFISEFNLQLQNKIIAYTYNVGLLKSENGQNLEMNVEQESAYKWNGKIALINATDYVRASTNSLCASVYEYNTVQGCFRNSETHNYLYNLAYGWTLSPNALSNSQDVWLIFSDKAIAPYSATISAFDIFPTFHLTSDITLSGEGTDEHPYEIVL